MSSKKHGFRQIPPIKTLAVLVDLLQDEIILLAAKNPPASPPSSRCPSTIQAVGRVAVFLACAS